MINLIKKHYGVIKAIVKKENNIVAYNNYDLIKEISDFLKLNSNEWTNNKLSQFARRFYEADNQGNYNIISNIEVGEIKSDIFFQVTGCLKKSSKSKHNYLHVLKLNNFANIQNFDLKKNEFLLTYFHECEHIKQCNKIRTACKQNIKLSYIDKIIISELLLKNNGLAYTYMLNEIQANYIALKRYKNLLDDGIVPFNFNNVYSLLKESIKLFQNINMGYSIKKEINSELSLSDLISVKKTSEQISSQTEIFSDIVSSTKEISVAQKNTLINNLNEVKIDSNLLQDYLTEICEYCINTCKEYNVKLIKQYFNNPILLLNYVEFNNIKNSIICIPELLKQNNFNAIEFSQNNARFIQNIIHKKDDIENINIDSIEYN